MFTKWSDMLSPRFADLSCATSSNSTSPAPMSASPIMNANDTTLAVRTRWPLGNTRNAQIASTIVPTRAIPLVNRWEASTTVAIDFGRGITSPLQVGQWLPHPAPEPEART